MRLNAAATASQTSCSILVFVLLFPCAGAMSQPLSALTEDSELVQILETSEFLSANDLVTLCSSKEKISVEFCEGYLRWATHFWKTSAACISEAPEEQSFCDGVDSARENIERAFMGCPDCDDDALDEPAIQWCVPNAQRDRQFCTGYNAELASMFASRPSLTASARSLGSDAADSDAFMHMFASREFASLEGCVSSTTSRQDLEEAFLQFIADNPAEGSSTAFMALARTQYYTFCADARSGLKPHMEQCTAFRFEDGQMTTTNTCDEAVVVQFQGGSEPAIQQTLEPGEIFATGWTTRGSYIYATCPAEHESSIPLDDEHHDDIARSHYSCKPKQNM